MLGLGKLTTVLDFTRRPRLVWFISRLFLAKLFKDEDYKSLPDSPSQDKR